MVQKIIIVDKNANKFFEFELKEGDKWDYLKKTLEYEKERATKKKQHLKEYILEEILDLMEDMEGKK